MKKFIYIALPLILFVCGCEDELNKQPFDQISEQTFWRTSTDAKAGLVSCYDALRSSENQSIFSWERFASFDLLTPIGLCRNPQVRQISSGLADPNNVRVRAGWRAHYRGAVRCNDFLTQIENVTFPENESDLKAIMIGEAKFLRAMYFYALTSTWGDVPYFDYVPGLEDTQIERTPQATVLENIKNDVEDAINSLPVDAYEVGRATKGAALALKTKIALLEKDWATAEAASKEIIDLQKYALIENYADIFALSNENHEEVIFDVQAVGDSDVESGNTFEHMFAHRSASVSGWSWVQPSLWLVEKYERIDPNPEYVIEDPRITPEIYDYFEGRDPRMDVNILRPGKRWLDFSNTEILYPYEMNSLNHSLVKMHMRKYVIPGDISRRGSGDSPMNFIIFRYADILLNYAEAKAQNSGENDPSVYEAINAVRRRASELLPLYTVGQFSKGELLENIYNERIRELPMEGWLYSDFKRWQWIELNDGLEVMGLSVTDEGVSFSSTPVETRIFNPAKHYLLPIPQRERDLNPFLTQNPNY
ncbi:MAG: RagB/SusD family nutrient uptake outer membrane protein [Bacteroidota bacterium]